MSRHNPRADRLNQLKRKRIPRSGPHLPVTDNLGSQEYKIKKEIAVMKLCRHPHVVRLLEVIDDKLYQKVYMGQFVPILLPSPVTIPLRSLLRLYPVGSLFQIADYIYHSYGVPRRG